MSNPRRLLRIIRRIALIGIAIAFIISGFWIFMLGRGRPGDTEFTNLISGDGVFALVTANPRPAPATRPAWRTEFVGLAEYRKTRSVEGLFSWPSLGFLLI